MGVRIVSERSRPARQDQAVEHLLITIPHLTAIVLGTVISVLFTSEVKATTDPAPALQLTSAAWLIDMIGVNTHLQRSDNVYGNLPRVLQLFKFLGAAHARDVIPAEDACGIIPRMTHDKIKFDLCFTSFAVR